MTVIIKGCKVEIDDEDAHLLGQFPWHISNKRGYFYVQTKGPRGSHYLHRLILGAVKGQYVDHRDLNTLNCKRENLRICNSSQSLMNRRKFKNNKSGYKCVIKRGDKWLAYIRYEGVRKNLGMFSNPCDASDAYKKEAVRMAGEFARNE